MPAEKRRRAVGVVLIALSATCFGALPIFANKMYDSGAEPLALLAVRFVVAALFMIAWMITSRRRWPRGRLLLALVAMGSLGYVGQSFSYFTALTMASASLVALLLYLYPAFVVLMSAFINRQKVDAVTGRALVIALAGLALVIGVGGRGKPLGIALGISAAVIYSIYIIVGSKITPQVGAIPSTAVVMTSGAVVFGIAATIVQPDLPETRGGWMAGISIAALSVVAIVSFFEGLERLGPADASTLSTLEPVVTVVLAAVVLQEEVTLTQVGGGVLILVAAALLARRSNQNLPEAPVGH